MLSQQTRMAIRSGLDLSRITVYFATLIALGSLLIVWGMLGMGGVLGALISIIGLLLIGSVPVSIIRLRYHTCSTIKKELVKRGCCPACGYDLRASRERCPECGRKTPRAEPATIEI